MNMDINIMRAAVTVIGLVLFLALVVWAWSRKRQPDFDAAAHLPFADSETHLVARSSHTAQSGVLS
jgi:cytochrome c oxidase cbb3-type subunit IV